MTECVRCQSDCRCEACHVADCGVDHSPRLPEGEFPTPQNCNPQCPEEAFLPYLVGLPGMKGASMALPLQYLRKWSRRLWDGGARLAEAPVIFYHRPRQGEINPMFAAGEWKSEPQQPDPAHDIDVSKLSHALQVELARQLDEKRKPPPEPKQAAKVVRVTRFDPNEHNVTEVLAHLRNSSDSEVRRVLELERQGSKRNGILKRYKEESDNG